MNKILIFLYISFSISIAQRPITPEDIVNLKTVSQASFHSDGSKIVYIKSIPSAKDGDKVSSFKEIWVTKSNCKDQKKYTSPSSSIRNPQWTPKGDISYLSRKKDFDKGFIELARSVYFTNDKRSAVKKSINILTDSGFVEEKSYEDY